MLVFKPLGDRIVVKPKDFKDVTPGGVFIPETAGREKPMEGIVVAVGPGKVTFDGVKVPMEVKKGDNVIFSKYAGTEVKLTNDIVHLMLREDDVLAIVMDVDENNLELTEAGEDPVRE